MLNYTYEYILLMAASIAMAGLARSFFRKKAQQKKLLKQRIKTGREGEKTTERFLERIRGRKKIVMNVFIPKSSPGSTTEIDIIMIHEKGIVVVENKNYSGNIYGKKEEIYWQHVLPNGLCKGFYNPVMQNQNHIKYLKRLLGQECVGNLPFLSVVTFNDKGKIKYKNNRKDDVIVTSSSKVTRKLQRKIRRMPSALTKNEIYRIYERLKKQSHVTRKVKKEHEREVKYYQHGR